MPRKGPQATNSQVGVTRSELGKLSYGTSSKRVGKDGGTPMGHCCLSLQPAEDPVLSPSGHLYSREAVYSYMLAKKEELQRQRAVWEQQQRAEGAGAAAAASNAQAAEAAEFVAMEGKVTGATEGVLKRKRTEADDESERKKALVAHFRRGVDDESYEDKRASIKRSAWWLPEFLPEQSGPARVAEPPKRPPSPITGRPLKLKDLVPVRFTADAEVKAGVGGAKGRLICAVSKKQLGTAPCVCIAKSGEVMLKSVFEELAQPSMTCPVTGAKFKAKDVIQLRQEMSGFAGGGARDVSVYQPAMR